MDLTRETSLINELREKVGGLLDRFSNDEGVHSLCHRKEAKLLFEFKTPDDIPVHLVFDINQVSHEYINNMMVDLMAGLQKERQKRHESPIILN